MPASIGAYSFGPVQNRSPAFVIQTDSISHGKPIPCSITLYLFVCEMSIKMRCIIEKYNDIFVPSRLGQPAESRMPRFFAYAHAERPVLGAPHAFVHFRFGSSPAPPISAVISSMRSNGNGGSHSGFIAMLISFIGLSSAATRLDDSAPQRRQR